MAVNFRDRNGNDFDTLFALNQSGQFAPNCGLRGPNGVDLSRRYEMLSFGTKGPNVEFRTAAGLDVSNLWAKIGTPVYSLGFNGQEYYTGAFAQGPGQGSVTATTLLQMYNNGFWHMECSNGTPTDGTWLPAGTSVSDYQFEFTYEMIAQYGNFWDVTIPIGWVDATQTRNISVTASVDNRNQGEFSDLVVRMNVRMRRKSDGVVISTSWCMMQASAQAWA